MKFSFGSHKKKQPAEKLGSHAGAHAAAPENKSGAYVHPSSMAGASATSPVSSQNRAYADKTFSASTHSQSGVYANSTQVASTQNQADRSANPQPEDNSQAQGSGKNQRPLSHDIAALLIRVAAMASIFLIIFSFIFDVFRAQDNDMAPSIQEGDMVVAYRLDKRYSSQDVVAFSYEGEHATGRVVAIAGDTVDIDKDGLLINGAHQYEPRIYEKTQPVKDGVTLPIKVPEGQIFILCDARDGSTDSRVLGTLKVDETEGKVIAIFRRRNI